MPIPLSKSIKEIYRSLYIGALLRGEGGKKKKSALKDERNLALLPGEENNKYQQSRKLSGRAMSNREEQG